MSDSELPQLNAIEARILGCLIEKKALTPDVYPLTLNALQTAANQKTSREPVMTLDLAEINRALKALEEKGLVRRVSGSRTERFEHLANRHFALTVNHLALLALLLLRGPQTVNELMTRSERMAHFPSAAEVRQDLDMLVGRRPPLVKEIGRAPGQREDRFAHLLSGDVDVAEFAASQSHGSSAPSRTTQLEDRIGALEEEIASLKARLDAAGI